MKVKNRISTMKYGLSFLICLAFQVNLNAQENVVHTGENITIDAGVDLYVLGSFNSTVSVPGADNIINLGVFHLQGDLIHDGAAGLFGDSLFGTLPTAGKFRFFGNPLIPATISGSTNIRTFNLDFDLTNNITTGGRVELQKNGLRSYGVVRFVNGGFELDTNVFELYYTALYQSRITTESINSRPYVDSMNSIGRIKLKYYPFSSTTMHNDAGGLGLSFYLTDGVYPATLERRFDTMGVGHPAYNNIHRSYFIYNPPYNAQFSQAKIKFFDPTELGLNPDGNILNIFVSEDMGQVWRPKPNNTSGVSDSTTSTGSAQFMDNPNFSIITAATPCNSVAGLTVNQIVTTVTPNDTILNVSSALVCDISNISARVFAVSDPGSVIEWRREGTNTYIAQSPPGYYEINSLDTFWVKSTSIRGCIDSTFITVKDTVPPSTAFVASPASVCLGDPITFNQIASFDANLDYAWSFGTITNDSSFVYQPSFTYTTIGTKTISLSITNQLGCSYSQTGTVIVKDVPVASFNAGAACPNTAISFDNTSQVAGYIGTMILNWDFDDSSTAITTGNQDASGNEGDTTHNFVNEGSYIVSLVASANGCVSDTAFVTVTVYPSPDVDFNVANACEGLSTTFNNTSSITSGTITSYNWDFTGAGPNSNSANPTYAYATDGVYNVTLTATSNNSCVADTTIPITIYENPIALFTPSNACVNNLAGFANLTTNTLGNIYNWNFGDGNFGTNYNESHSYTAPGTYPVILTVTTAQGCVGSANQSVVVFAGPNISFTALSACVNTPISFINTSTNAVSYSWNIPELAATPSTTNTTQTFPNDGTFPVDLAAISSNGCRDTITNLITIYPLPSVNLGGSVSTCGTSLLLDSDISNTVAAGGGSFLWNTGATTETLNATYNGTFSVTVTTGLGCSANSSVAVTLNANVSPNIGSVTVFCDSAVLDAGYPGSTYSWSPAGNTQSITTTTSGNYSVTVTDVNGCVGTSNILNVTVVPSTPVNLGADIQTACDDNPITLDAGLASSYLWSNGTTNSTLTALTTGYYWVENTNAGGCNSSDTVYINYLSAPVINLGNDQTVCEQTTLNAFTPNCTYLWSTTDTNPSILVTTSNTYIVVITDNTTTCDNSDTIDVVINPLPTVALGNDFNICSYGSGTIDAGNPGATYQWNSGQTTQIITVAATGNYVVTVTDVNGCTESDNISVSQLPIFAIDLGADRQFCNGSSIILDAGLTTTGNTFLWEDESSVLATTETWQVADTGMHYLTVTDVDNCVATDSINITPSNISLHAFFLADSDIENGSSVVFINLSYPRPYTSQWYLQNTLVSTDSMPTMTLNFPITPPQDTVYVKLKVDNTFCQSEITKPIVIHTAFAPPPGEGSGVANNGLYNTIRSSLLYPNPNRGTFNLMIDLIQEAPVQFNVFAITGALLHTETHTISTTVLPFDLDHLETGIYFIQIRVNNETRTHKFIVIHN